MADWDWQLPVAILCVVFAALILVRRGIGLWKGKSSCGGSDGCSSCSTPPATQQNTREKAFVSLESLGDSHDQEQD